MVRQRIGPVAGFKTAMVVPGLPKTRSGKILRGTMQKIADGDAYRMPATIDDSTVLTEVTEALNQAGYAKKRASQPEEITGAVSARETEPGVEQFLSVVETQESKP